MPGDRARMATEMTLLYHTVKEHGVVSIAALARHCGMSEARTRGYIRFFLWYGVVEEPEWISPPEPEGQPPESVMVTRRNIAFVEDGRFESVHDFFLDAYVETFLDTGVDDGSSVPTTSPYVIGDRPGFAPEISRLVAMLRYARDTTLSAVEGLSTAQLDHLHDEHANSIGMLLAHIAAVELAYRIDTLEHRAFTREETRRWGVALDLGPAAQRAIRDHSLAEYLSWLDEVRAGTLAALAARTDAWLYEETPFWNGYPANNFFKWFHVLEDEISHRGQIRWLRRRLPV